MSFTKLVNIIQSQSQPNYKTYSFKIVSQKKNVTSQYCTTHLLLVFDPISQSAQRIITISKNSTVGSGVKIKSRIAGLLYPAGWEYNTPAPEFEKSVH